jgi:hypothetical protein
MLDPALTHTKQGYCCLSGRPERYLHNTKFRCAGMPFILPSFFSLVLLERVKTAEKDMDKLSSGNATLQMYIDNLTLQMAKRR